VGKLTLNQVVRRKLFSELYGRLMRRPSSRKKIRPFVDCYKIDTKICEKKLEDFLSFDDFFSRKLQKTARPIAVHSQKIIFPCDGRHLLVRDFKKLPPFFIKGQQFNLKKLLQNDELYERFKNGVAVISRLNPTDYHRFHFPCNAVIRRIYKVGGDYLSVNPIALRNRIAILFEKKRIVSVLQSEDVEQFLRVEIGATFVGSITQTAEVGRLYFKGEEKGYFSFGGSTVMTIFKENKVDFAEDLCEQSAEGMEIFALMGDEMGEKK
ncbi:MAG: archaetidylserine decarboxylase, partial [Puniceicoccales bacterium]|jgi:phosphatidylserine decarboxylase|nr:archaetidylserine decarboxylase [Puniceicoccales bacterium]